MPISIAQLERSGKRWYRIALIIQVIHLVSFMIVYPFLPSQIPMRPQPGHKSTLIILELLALAVFGLLYWTGQRGDKMKINWPVKPGREGVVKKAAVWMLGMVLTYIAIMFFIIFLMEVVIVFDIVDTISPLWVIPLIFGNIIIIMRGLMLMQDANAGRIV